MRKRNNKEIQLTTYDDLLGISNEESVDTEKIKIVPLNDLYDFKDHLFRVVDDEKMEETTESIKKYGVLVPGIARPRAGGGYEIIAGHRRKRGSERAGKSEMSVIIPMMKQTLSWWTLIFSVRTFYRVKRQKPIL